MNEKNSNIIPLYFVIAILVFLSGYAFYILVRGFDPLFGIEIADPIWINIPLFVSDSYATFSHVLALSLFSYALVGAQQHYKIIIASFWILLNVVFELVQLVIFNQFSITSGLNGTFDIADLLAALSAGISFMVLTFIIDRVCDKIRIASNKATNKKSFIGLFFLGFFGVASIFGSSEGYGGYDSSFSDEPIYMSYEELRAPLKIESDRVLLKSGKIYIYQNLLLVSEPNKGIHIYDNTDPAFPVHKAFINLPGNLDIAVRSGYLYADSFIDLVVININDLNNITETKRIQKVFPYDPYQAIVSSARTFYRYDINKGVIIDVKSFVPKIIK